MAGRNGAFLLAEGLRTLVRRESDRPGQMGAPPVVEVPQIEGTFIEVETVNADVDDLDVALRTVRDVLQDLGISPRDATCDTYTDAVLAVRTATA